MRSSSDLNFDIFSSEKERICLICGLGLFGVVVEMLNMAKWSATSLIIIPDDDVEVISLVSI